MVASTGAWLALHGGVAFALSQRGHAFAFAFGSAGDGDGAFAGPSGLAVDQATGKLYVADYGNNRVESFDPVFGAGGELVGERFAGSFAVPAPVALAVDSTPGAQRATDPSAGDVYVVSFAANKEEEAKDSVYKFSATGHQVGVTKRFKEKGEEALKFGELDGVAIGAGGALYVYGEAGEEELVLVFDGSAKNKALFSVEPFLSGAMAPGVALNSEGRLYLAGGSANPDAYGPAGVRADVVGEYEKVNSQTVLEEQAGEMVIAELDPEESTAVAVNTLDEAANEVDELDDVYVANVDESGLGVVSSAVSAFAPGGQLIQRFTAPDLKEASALAVLDTTGAVFVADRAEDKVDVFTLQQPGGPGVADVSACHASEASSCVREPAAVRLAAQVDPDGGGETAAYFEYGTASCSEEPSPCSRTAVSELAEGFSDQPLGDEIAGLAPGTYHYRVVAENAGGSTDSREDTFTILAPQTNLPDGRAWELVSPPAKHGADISELTQEGGVILASEDGDALTYVTTGAAIGAEAEGNGAPEDQQVLATRGPGGWTSQDITTPSSFEKGVVPGKRPEYELFSSDLSLSLVTPANLVHPQLLAPGVSEGTSYLRDDPPIEPDSADRQSYQEAAANASFLAPGYLPLLAGQIKVEGATEDLNHIILFSPVALTGEGSGPGLYEWSTRGGLKYVSAAGGQPAV